MVRAFYPGTFDPCTYGHLNITTRAAAMFDEVIVGVAEASTKKAMFDTAERVALFQAAVDAAGLKNVQVQTFSGLMVSHAETLGAQVVVRGIRAFNDVLFEPDMTFMNRKLAPGIDIVFLMTLLEYSYVSSSRVKEIAALGADISEFVPPNVQDALRVRLGN